MSSNIPAAPAYGVYISQLIAADKKATEPRVTHGKIRIITPEVFQVVIMIWLTATMYPFHR